MMNIKVRGRVYFYVAGRMKSRRLVTNAMLEKKQEKLSTLIIINAIKRKALHSIVILKCFFAPPRALFATTRYNKKKDFLFERKFSSARNMLMIVD